MKNALLVLLALSVSLGAGAAPLFRNPLPVGTGVEHFDLMEEGDFDGDGHKDVLVIHSSNPTRVISVLLANGTGPFAGPVLTTIDMDNWPYGAATGDVNEDGKTDLVLTRSDTFVVMFGNGNGAFTEGPAFPAGPILTGPVALGDFNGDQHLDVAVATNEGAVEVRFGNGAGSFSGLVELESGGVLFLETLDINADGNTDLLAGNQLYLGNGSGGFTLRPGTGEGRVARGDFNHDGKLDLAVAAGQNHSWYVQVWFGGGDGTLTGGAQYSCGYSPSDIAAADIDADGNPDLLTVSYTGSMTVLRGKADGTFHAPQTWAGAPNSQSIATDDFDRDGKTDFVVSGYDQDLQYVSRLAFVRGNGDGTFHTASIRHTGSVVPVLYPGLQVAGGIIADMNGDHHPDVVISQNKPSGGFGNEDYGVLLNDGTGRLGAPILTEAGIERGPFAAGDVNNDGRMDLVTVAAPFGTAIPRTFLGNGDGTFGTPIPFEVTSAGAVFLGQFTADANPDLFIHSGYFSTVYPGDGSGTFGTGIRTDHNSGFTTITGDLNGDGKMDWVGSGNFSQTSYINDGTGHFTPLQTMEKSREAGALADFNGDGKIDLLLYSGYDTETRFGNGDGTFGASVTFSITPGPGAAGATSPVRTADFDGDGKTDVAFRTSVFLGNGDGRFRLRARVHMPADGIEAADMDGNGSPDLVTLNSNADDVAVFLTGTTSDPTAPSSVALSSDQTTGQYGKGIAFTATVTGGLVPLTGAVTFAVDGLPEAIVALDLEGKATFTTGLVIGPHNVTATYAGDENYVSSTDSMTQAVGKGQPFATISGFPNPRPARQLVIFTVALYAERSSKFAAPAGAMTLRDGNTPLNLTITNGQASTRDLTVGSHEISVDYPGDDNYEPATASYTQVITKPVLGIAVSATTPGPIYAGTPTTFRASSSAPNFTGTITFAVNDVDQATVPLSNGAAELQLTLPWGHHFVKAKYSGDDTWAATSGTTQFDVQIGPWGTPVIVDAAANSTGTVFLRWSQVTGGVTYTIWRKKTLLDGWQAIGAYGTNVYNMPTYMEVNKTWMYAATVTDENGNVSPMGPPDLATAVSFTDETVVNQSTPVKAVHVTELRAAIASVRTFAGLSPASYTNTIAAGTSIRASDVQEMRTALAQARTAIGVPAIAFGDPTLTPSATFVRAMHIVQLRAGTN